MYNYLTPFERNSFRLFNAFHDFEKDFFGGNEPVNSCKTDIRDEKDKYIVEAELPGFAKEDISIDINGGILTISAKHSTEKEDKSEDGKYVCRERSYGSYSRTFDISNINSDAIDAEYKNGILTLSLPKKNPEVPTSRRLEIK